MTVATDLINWYKAQMIDYCVPIVCFYVCFLIGCMVLEEISMTISIHCINRQQGLLMVGTMNSDVW